MEEKPLISVIIPTHNNAPLIGEAILSMINQTYPNLEIIVVDDNSTDNTEDVVRKYSREFPNVKYFKLPWKDPHRLNKDGVNTNAGYMSRNFGIEKARGEWITFQDDDDISLLNRIEVQYELAKKYNSNHLCVSWQKYKEEFKDKKLDVDEILSTEKDVIVDSQYISRLTRKNKGLGYKILGPIALFIPFEIKKSRLFRKFFFAGFDYYPGAANSPLVKRGVFKKVKFRPLNKRVYPALSGRGVDRDFDFRVAEKYGQSFTFNLPLYLWRKDWQNPKFENYDGYII